MNRTIKQIDPHKWYHLESLRKSFLGREVRTIEQVDRNNNSFTFYLFNRLWNEALFIVHPKTKRLRKVSREAFDEIGYLE